MKCECGNDLQIRAGCKVDCKNCNVLTNMTIVLTVQCSKCGKTRQVPVSGSAFMSVNDS